MDGWSEFEKFDGRGEFEREVLDVKEVVWKRDGAGEPLIGGSILVGVRMVVDGSRQRWKYLVNF